MFRRRIADGVVLDEVHLNLVGAFLIPTLSTGIDVSLLSIPIFYGSGRRKQEAGFAWWR